MWETQTTNYLRDLAERPAAREPATYSEIWDAEWKRSGLDTLSGSGRPLSDAYERLRSSVAEAGGKEIGELAREKGLWGEWASAGGLDGRARVLGQIADTFDEETRKRLDPLKDIRRRASEEAQQIERDAADVGAATYGLSGVATSVLAGIARQTVDPVNLATLPFGSPFKGPVLRMLAREAAIGAGVQAVQEPAIQTRRAELGLDAGLGRAATNIAEAGIGQAALSGLFRGGAAALRALRRRTTDQGVSADDFEAAAVATERDTVIEAQATPPTPSGRAVQAERVAAAADAIESGRPLQPPVRPVESPDVLAPPEAPAPQIAAARASFFDGDSQQIIRPGGERMTVRPVVMELGDLIASHDIEGRINRAYPAELQPRDRSAAASRTWISETAARLEPELLGRSPTAGQGAPIVGGDRIVESGNGRLLALAQAYERHPERATAYRQFIEDQGYDTADFQRPVLVRVREGEIADRAAFAREANVSATAGLSAREMAAADARLLDDGLLSAFQPGDIQSAANARFVRSFADRIVAPEERPGFVGADNRLSIEGLRRIEAALVARGWGDEKVVNALYGETDPSSKAIVGAFADTAPVAARVQAAVSEGRVPADASPIGDYIAAYHLVDDFRRTGRIQKLAESLEQTDMLAGEVPAGVRQAVRKFFRNDDLTLAASRDKIAADIEKTLWHALDRQNAVADLFAGPADNAGAIRAGRLAGEALDDQMPVGGRPLEPPPPEPPARAAEGEQPKPIGDPSLAADFARVLNEFGGDVDVTLPVRAADGTETFIKVSAKAHAAAADDLDAAMRELLDCIGQGTTQ